MFIIYKVKEKHLASEIISGNCPNCNARDSLTADLFIKYFHIFWMPFLPLGKKVTLACSNCNIQPQLNSLSFDIKSECSRLKVSLHAPRYLFTGFVIALLAGVFITFRIIEKDKKTEEYLYLPMAGDIYEIKTDDNYYSLCIIKEVAGDTIYINFHKYYAEEKSGLGALIRSGSDFDAKSEMFIHSEIVN